MRFKTRRNMERTGGLFVCVISLFFIGCGENRPAPPEASPVRIESSENVVEPAESGQDLQPVTETVSTFLDAVVRGNDTVIRSLLTPLARQKGAESGIPLTTSPGKKASFTIQRTVPKGEIGAYVHTTLTDVNEQGHRESAEIVWIVARCEEGWRIAGAAVALFEGQEKTVINFEDPESALRSIAEAERSDRQRSESGPIRQVRYNEAPIR